MRTFRQRITAVLLAVLQILTIISPVNFATADETYVSGEVRNTSTGDPAFCMTTQMDEATRSALAQQGYYIIVQQNSSHGGGRVSYASRLFSDITANGFEVFPSFKFIEIGGGIGETGALADSEYSITVAKLTNNNYAEWENLFEGVKQTSGKTDGSPAYTWQLNGAKNSDLVVAEAGPFDVRITFQDKNGSATPAPAVDGAYYLIALDVGEGGDFSADNVATLPSDTYWYIKKLEGFAGTATPTVVSVPGFSNVIYEDYSANPSHPIGTAYQDLPADVKSRIRVRLVHSTREIQTFGNLRRWAGSNEVTVYDAAINGSFAGYTPDAGNGPVADGAVDYQVSFRKKEPVKHTVEIAFDPAEGAVIIPGGEYYLLLEATSLDGTRQYYKTVELKTEGAASTTINLDEQWSNGQTFSPNWQNVTATVIRANTGTTITPGPTSPEPGTYTEAFTIGNNSFTYEKNETTNSSGNLTSIEHKLTLTANPLEKTLTPAQVLGPGINYGITAGVFDQVGHMETNFATNLYKCSAGNQVNVDPDLGNNTGAIAAAKIEGKMHMNSQRDVVLFVDEADANKVDHNTAHTILVESTQNKISESIVNPILNYGKSMSDTLKAKEATYAPGSPNIDLTQFPDGKTIYIDPSRIPSVFDGTGGGLNIKMHPGQTVVFNIPNENVKVGQIQYTFTDGVSWASDRGRERIAENTVFNMPNAKNVELNEAIGMFLIPRTDSKTTITQSSEGWVITGGTMTSRTQSNEWHNRNQNLSKTAEADAAFGKKLDGRTPAAGEVFEFEVYQWDENAGDDAGEDHWTYYDTIRNDGQSMNYTFKQEKGGHVFKIKETGKAGGTEGNYFYDEMEYYVTVVQMGYENIVYAAFPEYYTDAAHAIERFRNNDISGTTSTSRFKGVIDATEDTNSIGSITFHNETKNTQTAHLQAEKIINEWGNETEFSFVLKQALGGLYPPMPADAVNGSGTTYSEYAQTVSAPADRTFTKTVTVEKSTGVEASFGTIEYSEPGTYYYFIQEIIPGSARAIDTDNGNKLLDKTYANDQQYSRYYLDGMEYDNTPVTVAVAVASLDTEPVVTYDSDPSKKYAEFTNMYRRAVTDLKATKQIAGSRFNFRTGDKWTFTVTAEDAGNAENTDIPMPAETSVTLEPDDGRWIVPIDFGTIEYTIADAGKTYVYTITEKDTAGKVLGTKQVTVTVTEDPTTHSLTAIQTSGEGGTSFTNFDAGSTTASVKKNWVDRNGSPVAVNGGTATVRLIAVKEEEITPPVQTGNLTVYLDGNDDLPAGTSVDVTVNGVTQTLNEGSNWRTTFRGVPAGSQTVTTAVNGDYVTVTPAGTAVTITDGTEHLTLNASYLPPKKKLKVRIDWGSGEAPSGSITAAADDGTRVVLNSANNWTGDLHSMTAGQNYTVTLTDRNGVGYTPGSSQSITIANSDSNELVFSGSYNPYTAEIPVEISWNDVPENVSVTVTATNASGGNDTHTTTLNGNGTNWTGRFEGLREGADYTITARISGQNAENASLQPAGSQTVKAGSTARYTGHYEEGIPDNEKVILRIFKKSTGQNDNVKIYGPEEFRTGQPIAVTVTVHGWGFSANYRATNGQSGKTTPQNTNNDYTDTINFTFDTPGEHIIWIESPWGQSAIIGATASQAAKTSRVRNLFRPDRLIATSGVSDVSFADESPEISIQSNLQQLDQIVGGIEEGGWTLVGEPVELNQANGWQHDWGELPEYYRDEDGTMRTANCRRKCWKTALPPWHSPTNMRTRRNSSCKAPRP